MTTLLTQADTILSENGFTVRKRALHDTEYLGFEDGTIVGFLFTYSTTSELLSNWENDAQVAINTERLALRRAGQKAWNVYVVLLAQTPSENFESVALTVIEENLSGARKIARAGVLGSIVLKEALLALLPLQTPPRLEAVNSIAEIEKRTTALDPHIMEAFFAKASQAVLLSAMEGPQ